MRRLALLGGLAAALLLAGSAAAQPFAYIANLGADEVAVVDTRSSRVVGRIAVGDDPDGVAASPDGGVVYVANFVSNDVTEIDAATNTVRRTLPAGSGPVGLAVSPDGRRLYVANRGDDSVAVLDTDSGVTVATVEVGDGPNSVAVTPDGSRVYVTNSFARDPGTVAVIDAGTLQVRSSIAVQSRPARVAISPDGRTAYVTTFRSWNLSAIDTASDTVVANIRLSGRPSGVAVNPNGAYVYVTTLSGNVDIVDALTNRVGTVLPVGLRPFGIALLRNGGSGCVANFASDTATALDFADEAVAGEIPAGSMPFAVAVNCIGAACRELPWTPKPTRTRTATPTPSSTSRPSPTSTRRAATPTRTATPYPTPLTMEIQGGTTTPGGELFLLVRLTVTSGLPIIAVQLDLEAVPPLSIAPRSNGKPDCTINPAIDKPSSAFAFRAHDCPTGSSCVRASVIKFAAESRPITNGSELYRCRLRVDRDARAGTYPVHGEFGIGAIEDTSEYQSRVIDGAVEVVRSRAQQSALTSPQDTPRQLRLCSGGRDDGLTCTGDEECFGGFCVRASSVCDGGNDDGLLCQCSAGRCRSGAGAGACTGIENGVCAGGDLDGACCDPELNCAGSVACVATQRVCTSGSAKGAPCLRDEHCLGGRCESVSDTCLSGDFEGFSCLDDLDCPHGACSSSIFLTPSESPTPTPTPTNTGASGGDDDGCQLSAPSHQGGGGALLVLLPLALSSWRRRRAPS